MKVLLIEDDPHVAGIINRGLTENGFQISVAPDGNLGFQMAQQHEFDAVILDIMLPGMNGMELCRKIRAEGMATPVLFLTALGTTENVVAGLDGGGDDYLIKPFKLAELEARIRSLVRRRQMNFREEEDRFSFDEITVDFKSKEVLFNDKPLTLTSTEFRLLEFLIRNKNRVMSRMEILEKVWGVDFNMGTNVVDVYINYLRKKLLAHTGKKPIQTVIGMGYMLKT